MVGLSQSNTSALEVKYARIKSVRFLRYAQTKTLEIWEGHYSAHDQKPGSPVSNEVNQWG